MEKCGIWIYHLHKWLWNTIYNLFDLFVYSPLYSLCFQHGVAKSNKNKDASAGWRLTRNRNLAMEAPLLDFTASHLNSRYPAQGYVSSALKVSWHLPLLQEHLPSFVRTGMWTENLPLPVPSRLRYHRPMKACINWNEKLILNEWL